MVETTKVAIALLPQGCSMVETTKVIALLPLSIPRLLHGRDYQGCYSITPSRLLHGRDYQGYSITPSLSIPRLLHGRAADKSSDEKNTIHFVHVFLLVWGGAGIVTLNSQLLKGKLYVCVQCTSV